MDVLYQMAGDLEESTVNCVDAWVAKLLDGKTLAETEVVQLCNKVCSNTWQQECCGKVLIPVKNSKSFAIGNGAFIIVQNGSINCVLYMKAVYNTSPRMIC